MSSRSHPAAEQPGPFLTSPFDLRSAATSAELAPLVERAAVVGVGESAHFVASSNELRAALVEHLVADHGFTHLALEVGADEASGIGQWLRHEVSTPLTEHVGPLTHALYGTFLNELRRRLPQRHGIELVGVDLPNALTIEPSLRPLADLVTAIDPAADDLVATARRLGDHVQGGSAASSAVSWMGMDPSEQDALTVSLARLAGRIEALLPLHVGTAEEPSWRRAAELARAATTTELMLRAMAELFSGAGRPGDTTLREHYVAAQLLHALDRGGARARIAYVAHNNHIQKTPVVFGGELAAHPVGQFLASALGERYVAIALTHLGDEVPEMVVPADTPVGFAVEIVPIEGPRAGSIEAAASTGPTTGGPQLVRPCPGADPATATSIRSQSATADITLAAFDVAIVFPDAEPDQAVDDLRRPRRTEHLVPLESVTIAAESFGEPDDDAIVLVMGATASMLWWPEQLCERLARAGYRVVRYDHRDTGRSTTRSPGAVSYNVEDLTDDLFGVMDDLGIDDAHLVGMSLGGYLSQIAALREPRRVRSLTLLGSEPLGTTEELPGIDERFLTHFGAMGELDWSDRAAVEAFLVEIGRLSAGSPERFDEVGTRARVQAELDRTDDLASAFNHAMVTTRKDWTDAVDRISQSTLVIHGERDPILPLPNGEAIARRIRGAQLHVLPDAGHELNPLDLEHIADVIVAFVSRTDARTG